MPVRKIEKKADERGWLAEILRNDHLTNKRFGQIFITAAKPGKVKGNHYHTRKREFFCVIKGRGELTLQEIDKQHNILSEEKIILDSDDLKIVEIEPYHNHIIKNTGTKDMHLLVYIDEQFDPDDPDTFSLNG